MQTSSVPKRIAVLVPGILGSSLRYEGEPDEIWSSNFFDNYKMLASTPDILSWSGKRAEASFMTSARFSIVVPLKMQNLWRATIRQVQRTPTLRDHIHLYGYDWRASLIDTAATLTSWLETHTDAPVSAPRPSTSPTITFICHSMGGLLARIAVGLELLDPSWIFQMVNIGSPLLGSPSAFRTAYDRNGLPFLNELVLFARMRNSLTYLENMRSAFKTFPSLFQLFPPATIPILFYGPDRARASPLDGSVISGEMKRHASAAHAALDKANNIFAQTKTPLYVIYTNLLNAPRTDFEYVAYEVSEPVRLYIIRGVHAAGSNGDGTVPEYSAGSLGGGAVQRRVTNVAHSSLCNSRDVSKVLGGILK